MKKYGFLLHTVCVAMTLVLSVLMLASCGKEKDTAETKSEISSEQSGTEVPSVQPEQERAVLNITIDKKNAVYTKSKRPYNPSKQDISLILVVGQSNFTTSVGFSSELQAFNSGKTTVFPERPIQPQKGTVYSFSKNSSVISLNDGYDMYYLSDVSKETSTLGGVTPSFGTEWNKLTGTKTVFIQAAVGAVGVHEWTPDPGSYTCACPGNGQGVLYRNAVDTYKKVYAALSSDYNIVYAGYIWNQGEHDEVYGKDASNTVHDDRSYYNAYKSMHDGFMKELALDFGGISVVRSDKSGSSAQNSRNITIARAAQYRLCNDIDNLYMISTVSETCSSDMMDQGNTIHYSQNVFNTMGTDAADNLYKELGLANPPASFAGITLIAGDGSYMASFDAEGKLTEGVDKVSRGDTMGQITVKLKDSGDISTYSLSFTIDGSDANEYIDDFGKIDWTALSKNEDVSSIEIKCIVK